MNKVSKRHTFYPHCGYNKDSEPQGTPHGPIPEIIPLYLNHQHMIQD